MTDFIQQIKTLAALIPARLSGVKTEEATKTAFVMPFIAALGYNVFDPAEVVPEFIADVGIKKGEKIDYAIMKDGKPIIMFECKHHAANLDFEHASQLHRYFNVAEARVAVLTNGLLYRFYTDNEQLNKMDSKPFLELNMLKIKEQDFFELKRFCKSDFLLNEIKNAASELKYASEIQKLIAEEFKNPSEEFVRFFAQKVYHRKLTMSVTLEFTERTKKALRQFIDDHAQEVWKTGASVMMESKQEEAVTTDAPEIVEPELKSKIVTTEEEFEAYYIVKALLRESVDPKRIVMRDTETYCGILLDNNNRKPICRLHFNGETKSISIIDATRDLEKIVIKDLNDIYQYGEKLKKAVASYNNSNSESMAMPI
ncbi:type I restriction endonuclease [soil metagenome]